MVQILPFTPIHSMSRPFRLPSFEFRNKNEYIKKFMILRIPIFWDVTRRHRMNVSRRFEGRYRHHS